MLMMYLALIDNDEDVLVFENIYHTYRQQMIYVAESILGNFDDAEDAVQIALFGIAKSFKCVPITDDARLRAYVLTAAKNAAWQMLPEKQQRDRFVDIWKVSLSTGEDIFEKIALMDDYDALLLLIKKLSEQYQDVLMLRYAIGFKPRQIAVILNRKVTTVQQQISRGKQILAALYKKEFGDYV